MVFHPRPERPSEPNTGFVRYEPGAFHPRHRHDFAQVWHILEGTFKIGERTCGPGTVVYHAAPHYEEDLSTETGGLMFFVQYTGPETGTGPIYDGRFNMKERKPLLLDVHYPALPNCFGLIFMPGSCWSAPLGYVLAPLMRPTPRSTRAPIR